MPPILVELAAHSMSKYLICVNSLMWEILIWRLGRRDVHTVSYCRSHAHLPSDRRNTNEDCLYGIRKASFEQIAMRGLAYFLPEFQHKVIARPSSAPTEGMLAQAGHAKGLQPGDSQ